MRIDEAIRLVCDGSGTRAIYPETNNRFGMRFEKRKKVLIFEYTDKGIGKWTSGGSHHLPIDEWKVEKDAKFEIGDLIVSDWFLSGVYKIVDKVRESENGEFEYWSNGQSVNGFGWLKESECGLILKKAELEATTAKYANQRNSRD